MSTKIRKKSLVNNSISKKLSRVSNIRPDTLKDMLEQTLQTCFQEESGQDPPIVTGCYEGNVSKANIFKERNRKGECWALYDKVLGTNEFTSIGFRVYNVVLWMSMVFH
uniref:Uncharacterized protein n=1 Tax=Clastoptera arizonana TaxID=38151 RepID=A0A1B6DDW1_9HEMI